jgi:chlorophyllide a reductase subunit Y
MGAAGAGALAQVIGAAVANRPRYARMTEFFEGVGTGDNAGVWQDTPVAHPNFKAEQARKLKRKLAREGMGNVDP